MKRLVMLFAFSAALLYPAVALATPTPSGCDWGKLEVPLPGFEGKTVCDVVGPAPAPDAKPNKKMEPMWTYVGSLYTFATQLITGLGLIMVIVGGYRYMTAGGSGDAVKSAKNIVTFALFGIVLALTSYVILQTVAPQFVGK